MDSVNPEATRSQTPLVSHDRACRCYVNIGPKNHSQRGTFPDCLYSFPATGRGRELGFVHGNYRGSLAETTRRFKSVHVPNAHPVFSTKDWSLSPSRSNFLK